jgi:uncharacterized protein involved in exopolysaccharide biosynthesis
MTLKNIMALVEKYELYDEAEMRRMTKTEIVEDFNKAVNLDVISAEVVDPRSGRPTEATIAFNLSYDHNNPSKAQKVTNDLVTLYLNENLKSRTEKSEGASAFLRTESEALSATLRELESELAVFKAENEGSLPELYQYNLSIIERTEQELLEHNLRYKELEKRKLELEGELSQISKYAATVLETGERVLSDYDRLKALESDYRRKSAVYSDQHPDVARLKREIDSLKQTLGQGLSRDDRARMLKDEQDKLAAISEKYTSDHPKVTAQQRVVAEMAAQLQNAPTQQQTGSEAAPDNPSYLILDTQLKSVKTEMVFIKDKQQELKEKINEYEAQVMKAPTVEQEYRGLLRDYDNAQMKYREIKAKLMEAELAKNLEQGRKGERFTLIQPPMLPEKPVSPNRMAILFVGAVLAAAIGLGYIIVLEAIDPGIRGEKRLAEVLGTQPLMSMPYIQIDAEQKRIDRTKQYMIAGVIAAAVLGLIIIHSFIKPLDVIWFVLLRKFGLG